MAGRIYVYTKSLISGRERSGVNQKGILRHKTDGNDKSSDEEENVVAIIKRLEEELAGAVVNQDFSALKRIESEKYVWTDSNASPNLKCKRMIATHPGAEMLENVKNTNLEFAEDGMTLIL